MGHARGFGNTNDRLDALESLVNSPVLNRPTVTNISCIATGQTTLIAAQAGKKFIPISAPIIRLRAISGMGSVPILSIGNDGSFVNMVALAAATGIDAVDELFFTTLIAGLKAIDINSAAIKLNVGTAATYDTYAVDIYMPGFII